MNAHEKRGVAFEKELKRLLKVAFVAGNKALPEGGGSGSPSDYGFLDDEDMAKILHHAARAMNMSGLEYLYHRNSPGHYLYHRDSPSEKQLADKMKRVLDKQKEKFLKHGIKVPA
jgi:hypothetical protein